MKNLYQVLDIDQSASAEEIKKAFKKHAKNYHPDLHNGNEFFKEKFIEIKEAYDVLINPTKRKVYDEEFFGKSQNQSQNGRFERKTNFRQTGSSKFKEPNESQEEEIERILRNSSKKLKNDDLNGAIEELEIAESKYPGNGFINFIKGNAYHINELYIPALREYNMALNKGHYEAKERISQIERTQHLTMENFEDYLLYYAPIACLFGTLLYFLIQDYTTAFIVGESVNIIGSFVIIRIGVSKVSKNVLRSLAFNRDYISTVTIGVLGAIFFLPLVMLLDYIMEL
ncbi:J domain-containing protein [Cyclobacterium xiamenense]|uniref:J domain-containing protein n=1 Tax=Cyclobacterium xiamenense TaxID=1297121 RepID=UPI0012B92C81|nr:DnaJ domain-containing protein [Cyclobacterium xiamenense]